MTATANQPTTEVAAKPKPPCGHEGTLYWYPANNEQGWECAACGFKPGDPAGYSPALDVSDIEGKVGSCLLELLSQGWLPAMGSDQGEAAVAEAVKRCKASEFYDQNSVLVALLEWGARSHAKYWQEVAMGILSGNDPRPRCCGGNLSTSSIYKEGKTESHCSIDTCVCRVQRSLF